MQTTLEQNMMTAIHEIMTTQDVKKVIEVNGWELWTHTTTFGEYILASYLLDCPTGTEAGFHIFADLEDSVEFIKEQAGLKSEESIEWIEQKTGLKSIEN